MEKTPSVEILKKVFTVTVLNKDGKKIDEFPIRGGTNLWVFIRKRGIPIGSACSGVGVCGACHIKIIGHDEFCETSDGLSEQNTFEQETLRRNSVDIKQRLACLCRVYSNITIQADYW